MKEPKRWMKRKCYNTDANSDTDVSTSIPTRNRYYPLADCGPEDLPASHESDNAERRSHIKKLSLCKCPTVRYIWGTQLITTETEVQNAIAQLGSNQVSFRIKRRESTIKRKDVWYFTLLANQVIIEQITRLWTSITLENHHSISVMPWLLVFIPQ